MKEIKTEAEYRKIMDEILDLMNKGEGNLTRSETGIHFPFLLCLITATSITSG